MRPMLRCLALMGALAVSACAFTGPGYGGGPQQRAGYPADPDAGYPSGYGARPYGAAAGMVFRCESEGGRQNMCTVDTRDGVSLVRQLSSAPCLRGRTWDVDRRGVWVSQGCRGEFTTGQGSHDSSRGYRGVGRPGVATSQGILRCESDGGRRRDCSADTRAGVRLVRQLSSAACLEGRSWGYARDAVWVSDGCRAEFQVGVGASVDDGRYPGSLTAGQTLRCESADNRQRRCGVRIERGVELVRQLSSTRCVEGSNWGWDRDSIWVDRGCRGEFRVY